MNRLRSITLLGTCAAAGVALAIGVGVTVSSTPTPLPAVFAFPKPPASVHVVSREPESAESVRPTAAVSGQQHVEGPSAPHSAAGNAASRAKAAQPATVHLGTPAFANQTLPDNASSPVAPHPPYGQQFSLDAIQKTVK